MKASKQFLAPQCFFLEHEFILLFILLFYLCILTTHLVNYFTIFAGSFLDDAYSTTSS